MKTLKHDDLILCLVTLWAIWSARRKAIHEGIFQSPLSTYAFVESMIRDLEVASVRCTPQTSNQSRSQVPRWIAPPAGVVKINVDVAVRKQGNVGAAAAVCRSDAGQYLGASALVMLGSSDPAVLEAVACREALTLARDLHLTRIRVDSDCLEGIKCMEGEYRGKFSVILQEIKLRAADFALVEFVHERRNSNKEAHGLARSSAYSEYGRHVWLVESPDHFRWFLAREICMHSCTGPSPYSAKD